MCKLCIISSRSVRQLIYNTNIIIEIAYLQKQLFFCRYLTTNNSQPHKKYPKIGICTCLRHLENCLAPTKVGTFQTNLGPGGPATKLALIIIYCINLLIRQYLYLGPSIGLMLSRSTAHTVRTAVDQPTLPVPLGHDTVPLDTARHDIVYSTLRPPLR